jgi:hypothetical protein
MMDGHLTGGVGCVLSHAICYETPKGSELVWLQGAWVQTLLGHLSNAANGYGPCGKIAKMCQLTRGGCVLSHVMKHPKAVSWYSSRGLGLNPVRTSVKDC